MKIKNYLVVASMLLLLPFSAKAQPGHVLSLNAGIMQPSGDFAVDFWTGFGFDLNYRYFFTPQIGVGGTVGFNLFSGGWSDFYSLGSGSSFTTFRDTEDYSLALVPILANVEFVLTETKAKPLIGLGVGPTIISYSITGSTISSDPIFNDFYTISDTEVHFSVALDAGVRISLSDVVGLQFLGAFNNVFAEGQNISYFGLKAGVAMNF